MSFVSHIGCFKTCTLACSVNVSGLFIFFNKSDWDDRGVTVYDSGVLRAE